MNELIKKVTQFLPSFSFRLDGNKRLALLATAAIAATAIIVSVLWNGNHGYVSLYGSQENIPVSQIVTVLDGEKLEYRIDPQSGQILVPEETLSKTRMTLAAKGVQAMLPSGYELMDKDEVLGASQFVQNIRYKRSLEGELAQSIMTLDAVESARVHLALNEESSFVVSDEPQNSASVVVRLHYGSKLDLDQVNAIVHLVSGSVPDLKAAQVSVVDQAGNLLSDGIGAGEAVSAATRKRDQILKDIQDKTRASLANVLDSLVGIGNYRVPSLHQQVMRVFHEYEAWETDVSALRKVKDNMLSAFEALIARRTQRAEELKARMDKHQQNQEGMLAYSMVNLISEKA